MAKKIDLTSGFNWTSDEPDGASAVAFDLDTPAYSTAGAKLLSLKNNGTEKLFIDKDGYIEHASWKITESLVSGNMGIYSDGYIDLRPSNGTNIAKFTFSTGGIFSHGTNMTIKSAASSGNVTIEKSSTGNIIMSNLPTSDPSVAGALWNNSGVLTISAG